jgi:hypothetical protein
MRENTLQCIKDDNQKFHFEGFLVYFEMKKLDKNTKTLK